MDLEAVVEAFVEPTIGSALPVASSWLGERLDLGWAISVLHPAAATPTRDRL
jgi:hypothetical protein